MKDIVSLKFQSKNINYLCFDELIDNNNIHHKSDNISKITNASNVSKYYFVSYQIFLKKTKKNSETYINKNQKEKLLYHKSIFNFTHSDSGIILLNRGDYITFFTNDEVIDGYLYLVEICSSDTLTLQYLSLVSNKEQYFNNKYLRSGIQTLEYDQIERKSEYLTIKTNFITGKKTKIYNQSDKVLKLLLYIYLSTNTDYYNINSELKSYNKNFWVEINGKKKRLCNTLFRDYSTNKTQIIILKPGDYMEIKGYMYGPNTLNDKIIGNKKYKWLKNRLVLLEIDKINLDRLYNPDHKLLHYKDKCIKVKKKESNILKYNYEPKLMETTNLEYHKKNYQIINNSESQSYYFINCQLYHESLSDKFYSFIKIYLVINSKKKILLYHGYDNHINISSFIKLRPKDNLHLEYICNSLDDNEHININCNDFQTNMKLILPKYSKIPKLCILELDSLMKRDENRINNNIINNKEIYSKNKNSGVPKNLLERIEKLEKNNVSVVPRGTINLWYGEINDIPSNWVICDGKNGTPDLRGRVVIGYDGVKKIGSVGGSRTINVSKDNLPKKIVNLPPISSSNSKKQPKILGKYIINESDEEEETDLDNNEFVKQNKEESYMKELMNLVPKKNKQKTGIIVNGDPIDYIPPYCCLIYIMKIK